MKSILQSAQNASAEWSAISEAARFPGFEAEELEPVIAPANWSQTNHNETALEAEELETVIAPGARMGRNPATRKDREEKGRTRERRGVMFRSVALAAMLCLNAGSHPVSAQGAESTVLVIDLENLVQYNTDVFDASKFATDPSPATAIAVARNFGFYVQVGDIAAVNGKPAKGTFLVRGQLIFVTPTPNPGQGVADVVRNAASDYLLEIQQEDGTQVGCIYGVGLSGGTAPVGAPSALQVSNLAVVGGTGAFLGARGQFGGMLYPGVVGSRTASVTEDPANRRINGGGRLRAVVHLIPFTRPEIAATASGPAIFHSDFSPVTSSRPARAGEIVIVRATGLGPTRPGVNPGQPFPSDSLQEVNSPVEVLVGGRTAEVVNKVGWPGSIDTYRVDFKVPEGTSPGPVAVQLRAAWVTGESVQIPVQ